jgi:hypothetical protein
MGVETYDLIQSLLKFPISSKAIFRFFHTPILPYSHTFLIPLLNHYMYTADQGNFLHSW